MNLFIFAISQRLHKTFYFSSHLVQFLKLLAGGAGHVPAGLRGAVHGFEGVQPHEAGVDLAVGVAHPPRDWPRHHLLSVHHLSAAQASDD